MCQISYFSEMDFDIIIYFSFKPHTSCFTELARSVAKIYHLFSTGLRVHSRKNVRS